VPSSKKAAPPAPAAVLREQVERFLASCRQPTLLEPGDPPLPLLPDTHSFTDRPNGLLLQAWDETRTLARRIIAVTPHSKAKMILTIEKFGGKPAAITLVDQAEPHAAAALRQSSREILREHLRRWLARQFPGWRIAELTTGADLEHTLSPSCPRGLIVRGDRRLAALAAPPAHTDSALTHALIWVDYLRRRAPIHGLALFLPLHQAANTLLRLQHLNIQAQIFHYDETGYELPIDPQDHGNLISQLDPWLTSPPSPPTRDESWAHQLSLQPGVEVTAVGPGLSSFRVCGLEFARLSKGRLLIGIDRKSPAHDLESCEELARQLAAIRNPDGPQRHHPWFTRNPEAWLESVVRAHITRLDAGFHSAPVYGQVPALAGHDRGILDLLAIHRNGRLAVIELKAKADPNLPIQALDYWIRVTHHAAQGNFSTHGYFPGHAVSPLPPRLLLVAPAMEFHPTTEILLSFFSPDIAVERIGLGVEWQVEPKVVLRTRGAARPEWDLPDF
jgi:hypothetical protein